MNNEELVDKIHDIAEEVILDLDDRNKKEFDVANDKIDELNKNIKELIGVLNELI